MFQNFLWYQKVKYFFQPCLHRPKTVEGYSLSHAKFHVLSYYSFSLLFIFSKVIFNFFCVRYLDGISRGHYNNLSPVSITLFSYMSPFFSFHFRIFSTNYQEPLQFGKNDNIGVSINPFLSILISFFKIFLLRLNDSIFECLCLRCSQKNDAFSNDSVLE